MSALALLLARAGLALKTMAAAKSEPVTARAVAIKPLRTTQKYLVLASRSRQAGRRYDRRFFPPPERRSLFLEMVGTPRQLTSLLVDRQN
jgi:hypothetical protein